MGTEFEENEGSEATESMGSNELTSEVGDSTSSEVEDQAAPPQENEWTPNYKFKVMDKEHEFPEYIKGVLNKENYEEIKDVYLKAYGLPHVKERAIKYEQEIANLRPIQEQYTQQTQALEYLGHLMRNDFGTFVKEMKIPKKDILKYALDVINYEELPPEQKQEYDRNIESRQRLSYLERQNSTLQEREMQAQVHLRHQQLDYCLNRPEVKAIVDAFDAKVGQPGAFKSEVIQKAQWIEAQTSNSPGGPRSLSPEEAVAYVVKMYSPFVQSNVGGQEITPKSEKPVIPNIKAGAKGPVKQKIRSLADLRKRQQEME